QERTRGSRAGPERRHVGLGGHRDFGRRDLFQTAAEPLDGLDGVQTATAVEEVLLETETFLLGEPALDVAFGGLCVVDPGVVHLIPMWVGRPHYLGPPEVFVRCR